MSIFFNNSFGLKNNIENKPTEHKVAVAGKLVSLPEAVAALKEGSVFKGEVLDVRSNAVKILLGSNDILNARTDGSVQLNIGDILNFKVESNTGVSLLVKAVSISNTNSGLNMLMAALQSADVPVNERNLSLVKELIDNGQAIDKNTIKTLINNLNNISELDVKTAVTMFKHDIPITMENVSQFHNYISNNNKLIESFNNMAEDMVNTLREFASNHSQAEVADLANNMLRAVTGDDNVDVSKLLNDINNIGADEKQKPSNNLVSVHNEQVGEKVTISENQFNIENIKEEIKRLVKDSMLLNKEVFNKSENELKAELERYYKEIENKTNKLMNVLDNAGLDKSPLQETAGNVKSNLNFMNDINNMALYMQLPVKFNESEAHGELYVLNRNRHKTKENDVLTAFLHLDMENLGATDVSIKLEREQLTTKFSLEDTISQNIVEEHLDELKKRLEEKGYTATLLIEELKKNLNEDEVAAPFEKVLSLNEPKNYIKRYTLDVRA